ncbi:potassium-transporting ATPase subunit beta-like [Alosa pseudoharengus]|uniref:potassium-transporting ATPase subunit beta-like n=1 Tax=Alosa alosa TaxID=278164 RepID=UPI0020150CDF|nr:potassium-transporting ATPase subunit beta-like [Alosa alosa]
MATLKEKRTCGQRCEDFGRFVWNPDQGTLMGRTPIKWVYISLYYVAFYVVMTGLFALSIWVLMYTLDPYAPDYQDRLRSPGVMVWPDSYNEEDLELVYNMSEKNSWRKMSKCLEDFLIPYNYTKQEHCKMMNKDCKKGTYYFQKHFEAPDHRKYSCVFNPTVLGNCSGQDDDTFGYNGTQPCVIIKMNRIINFLPNNGTNMAPYVNCTVLEGHENVGNIEYFPTNGTFDLSYFPYYGRKAQPTYLNPLVAVKFHLIEQRSAKIQCRVVAHNIFYENFYEPYEGKVIFRLEATS